MADTMTMTSDGKTITMVVVAPSHLSKTTTGKTVFGDLFEMTSQLTRSVPPKSLTDDEGRTYTITKIDLNGFTATASV